MGKGRQNQLKPVCSSRLNDVGKMEGSVAAVKAVGGPPVHGLYDHHPLSPTKASTPILRGIVVYCILQVACPG